MPAPMSHAAPIIGPGCATQTAPLDRKPSSQLPANPNSNAEMSVRKNDATPMVIARGRIFRLNEAMSTMTTAAMAKASERYCGQAITKNESTSNQTVLPLDVWRKSTAASARAIARM